MSMNLLFFVSDVRLDQISILFPWPKLFAALSAFSNAAGKNKDNYLLVAYAASNSFVGSLATASALLSVRCIFYSFGIVYYTRAADDEQRNKENNFDLVTTIIMMWRKSHENAKIAPVDKIEIL